MCVVSTLDGRRSTHCTVFPKCSALCAYIQFNHTQQQIAKWITTTHQNERCFTGWMDASVHSPVSRLAQSGRSATASSRSWAFHEGSRRAFLHRIASRAFPPHTSILPRIITSLSIELRRLFPCLCRPKDFGEFPNWWWSLTSENILLCAPRDSLIKFN